MSDNSTQKPAIPTEIETALHSGAGPQIARYALGFLGGLTQNPFALEAQSGRSGEWTEADQAKVAGLFQNWLKLQAAEITQIGTILYAVISRLDLENAKITERIESPAYLQLVKRAFRDWSTAESEEKNHLISNLLVKAATSSLCSDDVVRLFLKWIEDCSTGHLAVFKEISKHSGLTRKQIWSALHSSTVPEESAETDLYRTYVSDLTMNHLIRQHRLKDYYGNYIQERRKKPAPGQKVSSSAFDDERQYELTELGVWFGSYTLS
jgi:hypothetical protein